jgi:hypothetical protein
VAIGLWLILAGMAGMVVPMLAIVVALIWYDSRELESIFAAFQAASLLLAGVQVAGHWLCLSVPKGVRVRSQSQGSANSVAVRTKQGLRLFRRSRPQGFPARNMVLATLILDVPAVLLLGWSVAAKFNLVGWSVPAKLNNLLPSHVLPDVVWLVAFAMLVVCVPLVFVYFLTALGRAINLVSWDGIQTLRAEIAMIFPLAPLAMASIGHPNVVAPAIGSIIIGVAYLAYVGLLVFLAPATRAYAAKCAIPEN